MARKKKVKVKLVPHVEVQLRRRDSEDAICDYTLIWLPYPVKVHEVEHLGDIWEVFTVFNSNIKDR